MLKEWQRLENHLVLRAANLERLKCTKELEQMRVDDLRDAQRMVKTKRAGKFKRTEHLLRELAKRELAIFPKSPSLLVCKYIIN